MKLLTKNMKISTKLFIGNIGFSSLVSIALFYIIVHIQETTGISIEQHGLVTTQLKAIKQQDTLQKQQFNIQAKIDKVNRIEKEFANLRGWMLDLSVSWLNEAEEEAEISFGKLETQLLDFEKLNPQATRFLRNKFERFKSTMLPPVSG